MRTLSGEQLIRFAQKKTLGVVYNAYTKRRGLRGQDLRGAQPVDLPVEQPTEFDLVVNLKLAKAIGLKLPPSLLMLADEVIE